MTIVELERIARSAVPPSGATDVVATVDVTPGGRLANGYPSGIGVVSHYGVAWLLDGRIRTKPIATFDRAADARRLFDLLRTGSTSRPAASSGSGAGTRSPAEASDPAAVPAEPAQPAIARASEVERSEGDSGVLPPERAYVAGAMPVPTLGWCKACGRELRRSETGQRRQTCDDGCRKAYSRGIRALEGVTPGVVDAASAERLSHLPRPPKAASPVDEEVVGGQLVIEGIAGS